MAKGDRKYGRNKKSAAMARYKAEGRDKVRKAKNVVKAKTKKEMKVPRGTARALRRHEEKPVMPPEVHHD